MMRSTWTCGCKQKFYDRAEAQAHIFTCDKPMLGPELFEPVPVPAPRTPRPVPAAAPTSGGPVLDVRLLGVIMVVFMLLVIMMLYAWSRVPG